MIYCYLSLLEFFLFATSCSVNIYSLSFKTNNILSVLVRLKKMVLFFFDNTLILTFHDIFKNTRLKGDLLHLMQL